MTRVQRKSSLVNRETPVYGIQTKLLLSLTEATALLSPIKRQFLAFPHESLERSIAQLDSGAEVRR